MGKEINSTSFSDRLKQFAFAIIYRSGKSIEMQFLLWLLEKLILLSSALMLIFAETDWSQVTQLFTYFKVFFTIQKYENIDNLYI